MVRKQYLVLKCQEERKSFILWIKPVNMIEDIISSVTFENELIFDPFIGSGSTMIASKNLNRKYIGFELDENYFKTAEKS